MKQSHQFRRRKILQACIIFLSIALCVWIGSRILVFFNTGAQWSEQEASYFHPPLLEQPFTSWDSITTAQGDTLPVYLQIEIRDKYLQAWRAIREAQRTGMSHLLEDHLASKLRKNINNTLNENIVTELVDLEHHLTLQALSPDRDFVAFRDRHVLLKTEFSGTGQNNVAGDELILDFDLIMRRIDGNWRIDYFKSDFSGEYDRTERIFDGPSGRLDPEFFFLGINYYPKSAPWSLFSGKFPAQEVAADFKLIKELGFNTIRIFVPDVSTYTEQRKVISRMDTLLTLASEHQLKCLVTLFDFPRGYFLEHYPATENQLRVILTTFRSNPAILGWDLKNEPDLDFPYYGSQRVLRWLEYMAKKARHYDPDHPITVGWSDYSYAGLMKDEVDFISFHDYSSPDSVQRHLIEVQASASSKPVVLTEFGMSTCLSFILPGGKTLEDQNQYFRNILPILKERSSGYMIWTLHDYDAIPRGVTGFRLWRSCPEKHFGLFANDGSPKVAISQFSAKFEKASLLNQIPRIKPFHLTLACMFLGILLFFLFLVRKLRSIM